MTEGRGRREKGSRKWKNGFREEKERGSRGDLRWQGATDGREGEQKQNKMIGRKKAMGR